MKLTRLILLLMSALAAPVAALGQTVFYTDPAAWSQQLTTAPTTVVFPNPPPSYFSAEVSSPFTVNGVTFTDPGAQSYMVGTCCYTFQYAGTNPMTITLPGPAYAVAFYVSNYEYPGDSFTITLGNGDSETLNCVMAPPGSNPSINCNTFVGAVSTVGFTTITIVDNGTSAGVTPGVCAAECPWLQNIEYALVPFACTIPPAGTAIPGAPVSWNKFSASSPDMVWVNAHIGKPSGIPTTSVTTVEFTGVALTVNNTSYALPNGTLRFDPSASATPMTTFDPTAGWTTTVNPNNLSDEIFFAGQALPVDSNLTGGGKATLSFTTQSTVNSLAFNWQWSAAAYTYWPSQWDVSGVWSLTQANGYTVSLNIQQQGSSLSGTANQGQGPVSITGSMSGTAFSFTAPWSSTSEGDYTATMNSAGQLTNGFTHDLDCPTCTGATWTTATVFAYMGSNDTADVLAYHNSLQAGSPLNTQVQQSLIQGPRGGGGSNYTGGWSGTGNGACAN